MRIASDALPRHLERGLQPVYAIYGEEVLLRLEAMDEIRAAARAAGFEARSSFTLLQEARFDWGRVANQIQTQTLFSERQIVEVHLPNAKPGIEGAKTLPKLAASLATDGKEEGAQHTVLLLDLGALDYAAEKTAWFKALEAHAVLVSAKPIPLAQLGSWLSKRLAQRGVVLTPQDKEQSLAFLVEHVQGNLLAAQQEIEKLALLYPEGEIGLEQLQASVQDLARYDVFQLFVQIFEGRAQAFEKMLFGLRDAGVSAVVVHWSLSEEIYKLAQVFDGIQSGKNTTQAMREARVGFGRDRFYQGILPKLNRVRISQLVQAAHWVDGISKGIPRPGWPNDAWQALLKLGLMLMAYSNKSA